MFVILSDSLSLPLSVCCISMFAHVHTPYVCDRLTHTLSISLTLSSQYVLFLCLHTVIHLMFVIVSHSLSFSLGFFLQISHTFCDFFIMFVILSVSLASHTVIFVRYVFL